MTPHDLLHPFCSQDATRPNLHLPFKQNDHLIGTDGRILIAIRHAEGAPPISPTGGRPVDTLSVFQSIEAALKQPSLILPTDLPTPATQPCKHCDGAGEIECDECGHSKECSECKGQGTHPALNGTEDCEYCQGTGKTALLVRVTIGHSEYSETYLRIIQKHLEVASFHPNGKSVTGFTGTFRADPGTSFIGGLMPLLFSSPNTPN